MEINADFSKSTLIHTSQMPWQASPMTGVRRRMLDRVGGEVARATSIVSYDPNSHFSAHVHSGGEEFIVLEGVFQDEHGDYPAGTYVRNPPQSSHTPRSEKGCVIFVKLWQFDPSDNQHVVINMDTAVMDEDTDRTDIQSTVLFQDERETVSLERWAPGSNIDMRNPAGVEILVLDGSFNQAGVELNQHAWLRLPIGESLVAQTGETGATVWVKNGHLRYVEEEKRRVVASIS
jgi:anti-sigma factor ChrR (cupin superfamily)